MRTGILIWALFFIIPQGVFSQPSQKIWGRVIDRESQKPLPNATVMMVSHEIALDLTNLTNRPNEYSRIYNPFTNQMETRYQQGIFFIIYYRVRF